MTTSHSISQLHCCPCGNFANLINLNKPNSAVSIPYSPRRKRKHLYVSNVNLRRKSGRRKWGFASCAVSSDGSGPSIDIELTRGAKSLVLKRFSSELETQDGFSDDSDKLGTKFTKYTSFEEDPFVDKLRTQLGVIHPMPSPPINRNIVGLFVFFFFVGVGFDKFWTSRKKGKKVGGDNGLREAWPQVPTSFSLFLEKDLQRKESVEWVNMVLGKLWKVYRAGLENWLIGLLQPVIDNLKKPDYVERVEIKQFSLGDEPLSVRNVERRTSRRVNDLQ